MKNNRMLRITVIVLLCLSAFIYFLQIAIFHDPSTTFFYIFQDMAFLPFSVAVATLIVGTVLNEKEKNERIASTRMLRSSFFTSAGAEMLAMMWKGTDNLDLKILAPTAELSCAQTEKEIHRQQKEMLAMDVKVHLNEEIYSGVKKILESKRSDLLVLSSNPGLMESECFTDMLWGCFHLIDEFRLRGEWKALGPEDKEHMEADFGKVFVLVLANSLENTFYLRKTYPNFYGSAKAKIRRSQDEKDV